MSRKKGTPNKVTITVREALARAMDEYFLTESFTRDLSKLEPKDRVTIMERFAAYVLPKLQATTLDMAVETKKTIEDYLSELAEDDN